MSIKNYTDSYSFMVCEQEQRFRDLFGKDELDEARKKFFSGNTQEELYLKFLREETERKLQENEN